MIIGELTETYPPMLDGVGRVTMAYCHELERAGHTAYYIAPEDPDRTEIDGLRTLLYHGIHVPGQNYQVGVPNLSPEFQKRIREISFDVLHIHSPFLSYSVAKRITSEHPEVPVVVTFHSKYYDDFYRVTHSKKISDALLHHVMNIYNHCDAVWTVNDETAQVLREYGYGGEIYVTPNGTDLYELNERKAAEKKQSLGLAPDEPVLLFVGQIDLKKNIPSVMKACAILKREGVRFTLLLVGRGPDQSRLEKLRDELDIADRTRFVGFVGNGEELRSLYQLADLFVFPSIYDNAPMVVREAAANGTPALVVRGSCSAGGITDGENGFLCENQPESIAGRIREALPICHEVGVRARNTIPQPWERIIQVVIEKYQDLIQYKRTKASTL